MCAHVAVAQDGSLSVWRRMDGQLTYQLLGLHKLIPPPSRVNNNATLSMLCAAAAIWVRARVLAGSRKASASAALRVDFRRARMPPTIPGAAPQKRINMMLASDSARSLSVTFMHSPVCLSQI